MSDFHHTREIQAAAEAVFQAFSDPVRLARWWGPDGFTSTIRTFEFAPGGEWDFTMRGPDGASYPNRAVFTEIVPNASIVLKHVSNPRFLLSISLAPSANGTRVSWIQEFEDPAIAENLRPIVEPANANKTSLAGSMRSPPSPRGAPEPPPHPLAPSSVRMTKPRIR